MTTPDLPPVGPTVTCKKPHRLDELEFAGCAACAWQEYHAIRVRLTRELEEARAENARLREVVTIWETAGTECVEIQREWPESGDGPGGYAANLFGHDGIIARVDRPWFTGDTPFDAVRRCVEDLRKGGPDDRA